MTAPSSVTLSKEVKAALEKLAAEPTTAARYFDARDEILAFVARLRRRPSDAKGKSAAERRTDADGAEYAIYVIPTPVIVMKSIDVFGVVVRIGDLSAHVHAHRDCRSAADYMQASEQMLTGFQAAPDLRALF